MSAGKIINIVTNDLNSLMGATFILLLILTPAIIIFTMVFLWMEFGVYSLWLLLAFIISTAIQGKIALKM